MIEFFLCKQAQFVLCMWDQFVGVDCFLSTPSVLLFLGVFFVFFFFLKPSSECCMWDQFVGVVGGVGSTVFFV